MIVALEHTLSLIPKKKPRSTGSQILGLELVRHGRTRDGRGLIVCHHLLFADGACRYESRGAGDDLLNHLIVGRVSA